MHSVCSAAATVTLLLVVSLIMKLYSLRAAGVRLGDAREFMVDSPFLSIRSLRSKRVLTDTLREQNTRHLALTMLGLAVTYAAARIVAPNLPESPALRQWLLGYAILPFYGLLLHFVALLSQRSFFRIKAFYPAFSQGIFQSTSLQDFWSNRWNYWVSDWNRQAIFRPLGRSPIAAMAAVFVFSGIWHEVVFAVPYFLVRSQSVFGLITAYFLVQFVGILVDRALRKTVFKHVRGVFCAVWVVGPIPLFLNPALQSLLGVM